PVTAERHTANPGALLVLNKTPDRSESVSVTIDPDGAGDVTIEDVDYEITGAGVYVLEGGAISEGTVVAIDYTSAEADVIEAMTGSGDEYELVFDGLNEAESGRAVTVTAHRVKFSPTTGLALIGDDFGELSLDGSLLVDSSKVGAGVSRYFKVAMAR
ncbi:phage tail tube protein, partial [Cobetia marina]